MIVKNIKKGNNIISCNFEMLHDKDAYMEWDIQAGKITKLETINKNSHNYTLEKMVDLMCKLEQRKRIPERIEYIWY